jgi:hypothetical protein
VDVLFYMMKSNPALAVASFHQFSTTNVDQPLKTEELPHGKEFAENREKAAIKKRARSVDPNVGKDQSRKRL